MMAALLALLLVQDQDPKWAKAHQSWSDCLFKYAHEEAKGIQTPHFISGRAFGMCRLQEAAMRTEWARVYGTGNLEGYMKRLRDDARQYLITHVEKARARGWRQ